jgi:hypothetical protein
MLVPDIAFGEGLFNLWERLELARDADPFGGGPSGQVAPLAHPGHRRECAVGLVLTRLIKSPQPTGEDRLQRIDPDFPDVDQTFTKLLGIRRPNAGGHSLYGDLEVLNGPLKSGRSGFYEHP